MEEKAKDVGRFEGETNSEPKKVEKKDVTKSRKNQRSHTISKMSKNESFEYDQSSIVNGPLSPRGKEIAQSGSLSPRRIPSEKEKQKKSEGKRGIISL